MTKEESIALAEQLSVDYGELENIRKEISDNKEIISKPLPTAKHHAAFKFFWPYLIGAVVTINVLYIIGTFISLAVKSTTPQGIFSVIGLVAMIVILIVGGKTATSTRDSLNYHVDSDVQMQRKRHRELQEKTKSLENIHSLKKSKLEKYDELVPLEYRSNRHMDRVKALIQTGKAEDFSEAIALLSKQ